MAKTHYQVLGVEPSSTAEQIRSAYRKLAMLHHPDRSKDPQSKALFLAAAESYEVLGDKTRRQDYDSRLAVEAKLGTRRAEPAPKPTGAKAYSTPSARIAEIRLDINRLNALYSRGNFSEAEELARSVIERDRRQPIPYAILGNIAQMKGNRGEAIKMYGSAIHFDPRNLLYQQQYDELVELRIPVSKPVASTTAAPKFKKIEPRPNQMSGPLFGMGLILLACIYIIYAREPAVLPTITFIKTWTLGIIAMLFFSGVVLGACMSLDGLLENYSSMGKTALGKISPTVALATIAVVNFWAAVLMYVIIGLKWKTFNHTTSRIIASVIAGTCLLAIASDASDRISGVEVFAWGGNLVYLGSLCGWMVTDALRGT